ncbi:MAG: DbpA RNA binding domain-containing protein [Methylobacter sp.]|uniref:DbpA RNA binding domain-containing protein n=1 Tax=Candidatus Methylobacter titanis TaxID=3053457 RepID=A0AA43Q5Z1_9GAMM|nr:DbpA RNA binding domain-containing protein [Candidatus Methylobacter titanis]MDI1292864.1 DbpA RNA binding domain-containing protein [Candidatus Methylobacter titanis]
MKQINSNHKDSMAVTVPDSLAAFSPSMEIRAGVMTPGVEVEQPMNVRTAGTVVAQPGIKMVRYRLGVGCKHQINSEELKKVLIDESGVDKNNINNINIQGDYTLVELPDEMPQDIFLHLKSVEIKQHKLDIRRVKARNKKRDKNQCRRGKQRVRSSGNSGSERVSSS